MKNNNEIQIQFVPIELLEYNEGQIPGVPENPRTREDTKQRNLEKSIEELPEMTIARAALCFPYNGRYVVIGGNRRLEAQRALKRKEVPIIALPEDTPVDKLRRMALLDNESTGQTDWTKLAKEWSKDEIRAWNIETPKGWFNEVPGKKAEEDNYTEPEKLKPRVKPGEIWQLGEHKLMCGDSTDSASVALLMDGQKADMVFTDPPYGVSIGDKNKALNSVQKAGSCTENIANDNISVDDLYPILVKAMTNCRENCKDCACYYVTSPQGGELALMMMMMKDAGLPVRHMLIWEKNSATFSLGRLDYDYQHEPIFYTWTKSHKNYRNGEFRTTIWKYNKPRKCDLHPTMKPVELVANCIMDASIEGDIVLDMFGGSGSTLIACEQLNRKCYMMELTEHYCDVIINRWETLTGRKAVKIG